MIDKDFSKGTLVKKTIPKKNMVVAFLRSKDWELKEEDEKFLYFTPPTDLRIMEDFDYKIPRFETALDFSEYMIRMVYSIADLYQMDKHELRGELSKSLMEIEEEIRNQEKDIEFKRRLLANAS